MNAGYVGPNISGTVKSGGIFSTTEVTGVFTGSENGEFGDGATHYKTTNGQVQRTFFGSDKSNFLFGGSTTIQPRSLRLFPCIKA